MTKDSVLEPAHSFSTLITERGSAWPEFRTRFHCKTWTGMLSLAASDVKCAWAGKCEPS